MKERERERRGESGRKVRERFHLPYIRASLYILIVPYSRYMLLIFEKSLPFFYRLLVTSAKITSMIIFILMGHVLPLLTLGLDLSY